MAATREGLAVAPLMARVLPKVVLAVEAPVIVPPVHVAAPWKVLLVPVMVLPLRRNGVVCVPPFTVTSGIRADILRADLEACPRRSS